MSKPTIFLIVATRKSREEFFSDTSTGKSFNIIRKLFKEDFYPFKLHLILFAQNTRGLSGLYNQAINQFIDSDGIFVFMHDDVSLCDFWWADRIDRCLNQFDVVGVAGCKVREPHQPAWPFHYRNGKLTWLDFSQLSGLLRHETSDLPRSLARFGHAPAEVKLLDGVLLACRTETLRRSGLRFDPQFQFHFYDMDFCRRAEQLGLTMGSCDVSIIHDSDGGFNSREWQKVKNLYFAKWGD